MKVLVHYDAVSENPLGIWWVDPLTHSPENLYLDSSSASALRGRIIVMNRSNPEVAWEEWFDQLTTRAPYTENWIVYDSMGMTPLQLIESLRPPQRLIS